MLHWTGREWTTLLIPPVNIPPGPFAAVFELLELSKTGSTNNEKLQAWLAMIIDWVKLGGQTPSMMP